MMAHKRSILCVLALVGVLVVGLAGCRKEEGWLGGRVTIGPLAPVAQAGAAEPTADPAVYAARQVVVFDAKSGAEVLRAGIDTSGQYRVALPVGSYVVDINHAGIDTASGLPLTVEIRANEETRVDIAIDTGIR